MWGACRPTKNRSSPHAAPSRGLPRNGAQLSAGMKHFVAPFSLQGPVPADFARQPASGPTMYGTPTDDDGRRDDLMLGSNILTVTSYRPDRCQLPDVGFAQVAPPATRLAVFTATRRKRGEG